ncbi:MAG: hypothetical protein ACRD7E_24480, partial [Bryobacteraceae bacterium]
MLLKTAFCLVLVAAGFAALADEKTKLTIQVVNHRDKPVDLASVIVTFDERKPLQVRTNQDGIAKFPEASQGKVRVQIIAKGYQTFGDTFEVDKEKKELKIKL